MIKWRRYGARPPKTLLWFVTAWLWAAAAAAPCAATAGEGEFERALTLLKERGFAHKQEGVEALVRSGHAQTAPLLQALLDSRLYLRKSDGKLVYARRDGREYHLTDALTGTTLGTVRKRKVKKISINNRIRGHIQAALAALELADPDPAVRLAALASLVPKLKPDQAPVLRDRLAVEQDPEVRDALGTALALLDLEASDSARRLAAIDRVSDSLEPAMHRRLVDLAARDADPAVRESAAKALEGIELKRSLYSGLETLFFGLSLGSVLVLAAIGLAITFGVMGVINMAHGELIMLGAYTTYVIQQVMPSHIGLSLLVAVPAAFVVSGLVGIAIERGIIRFLYGRPLETLLATFGLSLVLQQAVRSLFSPLNRTVETPEWMSGSIQVNALLSLTTNRLIIIVFCLLVFAGLWLILKRTRLGLQVRAVSQNRAMARAMGVRSEWVDALTFGLGAGVAGMAGVALSQLTNVGPNLGQAYIIDSFLVVVFGGVGNLWGTLVGGLGLGVANKVLEPWAGAVLAKILVLVFVILFMQRRPRGLFPQRGRAAEG